MLSSWIYGGKWKPFKKFIFIIQMCLEKPLKFWKSQGKIREFHQEQNVETMVLYE